MTRPPRPLALALTLTVNLTLLAGCGGQVMETTTITPTQRPDETPVIPPEFDTAATRNCLTLGGTLTIDKGEKSGLCALPGGSVVNTAQLLADTRPQV